MGWSLLCYSYLSWSTGQDWRQNKRGASTHSRERRGVRVRSGALFFFCRLDPRCRHGYEGLSRRSRTLLGGRDKSHSGRRAGGHVARSTVGDSSPGPNSNASCAGDPTVNWQRNGSFTQGGALGGCGIACQLLSQRQSSRVCTNQRRLLIRCDALAVPGARRLEPDGHLITAYRPASAARPWPSARLCNSCTSTR